MELVKDILRTIRVEGSLFFQSELNAPWGLISPKSKEPKIHIALHGECLVQSETMAQPVLIKHGDVILIPDGEEHWIADDSGSKRLPSNEFCKSLNKDQHETPVTGPSVQLLCGLIRFDRTFKHPLIKHLPSFVYLSCQSPENAWLKGIIAQFESELDTNKPYSEVFVDRLFEVLFLQVIRDHVALLGHTKGFWAALQDPKMYKVLKMIHERFTENLNVESLASEVYLSRSVFMERFTRLIGESPSSYLTAWRMHKSLSLLGANNCYSIYDVAEQVGYASPESFSKAFKRHFGVTPHDVRQSI